MVGRTRAQAAKAAVGSFDAASVPSDSVQIRIQEVVAYFEAQVESGVPIDITKDVFNKVDEIVDHCAKTGDHIQQTSIDRLLSCIEGRAAVSNLSPEALTCLLNLLKASGPGQHKIKGLSILLEVPKHKTIVSVSKTSINQGGPNSIIDELTTAVKRTLQERIRQKTNDEKIFQLMMDLLVEDIGSNHTMITESPLDVRAVSYKLGSHISMTNLNGKRIRDEIPDTFDDPSNFDFQLDDSQKLTEDDSSNSKPDLIKVVPNAVANLPKGILKLPINQQKRRKRLKGVTEAGSPIPMDKTPSKQTSVLPKLLSPELECYGTSAKILDKERHQDNQETPQPEKKTNETSQANKPAQQPSDDNQPEGEKKDGCHEHHDGEPHDVQPCIVAPNKHISMQESSSPHADQIIFDQYLDFDGGVTIVSQYPEDIFSSPERTVPVKDTDTSKALIDVRQSIQLQTREVHSDCGIGIPRLIALSTAMVEPISKSVEENVIPKSISRSASPINKQPEAPPVISLTSQEHPSPMAPPAIPDAYTPAKTCVPNESEHNPSRASQISRDSSKQDARAPDGNDPFEIVSEGISLQKLQQLVAAEVDKAIKKLGNYLCSTNHQDLGYPEKTEHSTTRKDNAVALHNPTPWTGQLVHAPQATEVPQPSPFYPSKASSILNQSEEFDKTLVSRAAEHDLPVVSVNIHNGPGISSSTINSNCSSPSPALPAPVSIPQQIHNQVQDFNPDINPLFLEATTLLTNAFCPLNNTPNILNQAVENYNTTITKHIDQIKVTLNQNYQKTLQTTLSRLDTSMNELNKLQAAYQRPKDPLIREANGPSRAIPLIDLALKSLEKQIAC